MKKYFLLFIVSILCLSACKKPAVDTPLPTQGPDLELMQPSSDPN